ncbi:tetraspanin-1 isoform X2 [Tribolium castaneum]|uniref:tetraspanin-1 isoform X2 n=1 Tax=Tribolium castaneum TaxID=7070 RepID=UPI00077DBEE0|nr:PREDICTED: tetraspanin-1 isoform X2 [Tribolium castaneum]|eukprot:XP_015839660.1 PREDICTED: tetraspanin-1 isoform X2 [Tribolium castaneum]
MDAVAPESLMFKLCIYKAVTVVVELVVLLVLCVRSSPILELTKHEIKQSNDLIGDSINWWNTDLDYRLARCCRWKGGERTTNRKMVYDCGSCLAKYILCAFNFIIFLAGSVVLAVGIWLAVDKNSFVGLSKIVPSDHVQYGICLLVILIAEIAVACLTVAYKPKAEEETRKLLKSTIENYYSPPENKDAVTLMWDHLQANLKCCGVNNYTDYRSSTKWTNSGKVIPESCCVLEGDPLKLKPKVPSCVTSPNEVNSYYKQGCFDALVHWIMIHVDVVIGVAVGLGLLELVGIFLAFCLAKALNGYIK